MFNFTCNTLEKFKIFAQKGKSFVVSGVTSFFRLILLKNIQTFSGKKVLFITSTEQSALKLKNDYKDKDNETIADLEQQITDYKTKLKQITIDNAIKIVATEFKAKDSKDLAKFLDMDKITMNENGEVAGVREQVDELVKNKSYLFEVSETDGKSP